MKLKAIIFDVDGTLADNEEVHRCSFNDAFAQFGLDWNWSQSMYARLLRVAGGKERLASYIESLDVSETRRADLYARIAELHDYKTQLYMRKLASGVVPLRDGVARLIDEAGKAGVDLAIASATAVVNVRALLQAHLGPDALQKFRVLGCDDQVPRKKPAPDIYEWVLAELALPADDCAAIEDSNNGLRAAKAAGLFTVVTPSYWTRAEDFSLADLLLPSLGSPQQPLPDIVAAEVGGPMLGVRELDMQLRRRADARA